MFGMQEQELLFDEEQEEESGQAAAQEVLQALQKAHSSQRDKVINAV
jgi:hypothetical protein